MSEQNNINPERITELNKFLKKKSEVHQLYNPEKHPDWMLVQILGDERKPEADKFFSYEMADGTVIYTISDGGGYVFSPPYGYVSATIGLMYDNPKPESKIKYFLSIAFFVVVVFLAVFGEPLALYLRELNDPMRKARISAGGDFNKYRGKLTHQWDSVQYAFNAYFVFTNDTATLEAIFQPYLEFYSNPYTVDFVETQSKAEDMKQFLKNSDTLGYNLLLKTSKTTFKMMNISKISSGMETEYKVAASYLYTDSMKDRLAAYVKDTKGHLGESKEERLAKLDEPKNEIAVFSQTELENGKLERGIKTMMAPRINLDNPSYLFYFSVYSKNTSMEGLERQLQLFSIMFLNGNEEWMKQGKIRVIYPEPAVFE